MAVITRVPMSVQRHWPPPHQKISPMVKSEWFMA
jgi:hypothetical protein